MVSKVSADSKCFLVISKANKANLKGCGFLLVVKPWSLIEMKDSPCSCGCYLEFLALVCQFGT